jgi:hypothetical protein
MILLAEYRSANGIEFSVAMVTKLARGADDKKLRGRQSQVSVINVVCYCSSMHTRKIDS